MQKPVRPPLQVFLWPGKQQRFYYEREKMSATGVRRKKGNYFSYLLRLWRETGENKTWRASLESAENARRIGFSNLESLFEYLQKITAYKEHSEDDDAGC